jgi:hypothetical protein
LNVHGANDVRQAEMHTAEPLVPEHSSFNVEITIKGIDQILLELIKPGGNILWSEIHKLINSIWTKKEIPQQWK